MKINRIDNSYHDAKGPAEKLNRTGGFDKILGQKLNQVEAVSKQPLSRADCRVLDRGDRILNLLDRYADELGDSRKTLKDMEPLVKDIEREVDGIRLEVSARSDGDMELARLVEDLAVAANVAIFRFHRGDYL